MLRKALGWVMTGSWWLLVAFLPISSLPLIARAVGSSSVAALSGIFLLILVVGSLIPFLLKGGPLPGQVRPLLGFLVWCLAVTAISMFGLTPGFKDMSPLRNQIESLVTLAIGVLFYLVTVVWAQDERRLGTTLKIINWSGLAVLIWCGLQAAAWYSGHRYPLWMREIQDFLSMGVLYRQRVTGFALEPSWLAHQLNLVYLPLWLAATVKRTSAHSIRILKLSFENLLLIGGIAALWLSYSRVGLLGFALMLAVLIWRATVWLVHKAPTWILSVRHGNAISPAIRRSLTGIVILLILVSYIGIAVGGLAALSKLDPRMADVFNVELADDNPLLRYANSLKFGERIVYWQTGWNIFTDHPLMGVGLGNAGFYFEQKMPAYGWFLIEVRRLMFRENVLLNIKSLWVRLLAETGVVGFVLFLTWLLMLMFSSRHAESLSNRHSGSVGLMGLLMLAALLAEGFSIDSFALPYLWFTAGLATAAAGLPSGLQIREGSSI